MKRLLFLLAGSVLVPAAIKGWKSLPDSLPSAAGSLRTVSPASTLKAHPSRQNHPDAASDPGRTLEQRTTAVRAILANGSPAEVARLLAWLCANMGAAGPAPDDVQSLMAELSSPLSPAALAVCLDVILDQAGELPGWDALPTAFADSLVKGLRHQPSGGALDALLLAAWQTRESPAARQRLESLEIPGLLSGLAAEQLRAGSEDRWTTMARLETCPHPETATAILALATLPGAPVEELGNMLYNWSSAHLGPEQSPQLVAALGDPDVTEVQQGLAALALAAGGDRAEHLPALAKALDLQPPGWLRQRLDQAIALAREPLPEAAEAEVPAPPSGTL